MCTTPLGAAVVPSEEHSRHVAAASLGDLGVDEAGIAFRLQQVFVGAKLRLAIMAQSTRIVVIDPCERRAARQDFEQLVDLLLVLGERHGDLGVLDWKHHLFGHRVLIKRHGHGAQALHRAHRRVKPWTVVAHQRDVRAAPQTVGVQAGGERAHFVGKALPRPRLPDAEILLADGRPATTHLGVMHEQLGNVSSVPIAMAPPTPKPSDSCIKT